MAPRKKTVRKQTQTETPNLSRTIQTRTSAKGVLDEITPLTNSDQEEQTVTTLKQERVGQSRTTSLRRRGPVEASFRFREEIQPVEDLPNHSSRDTSPSVDVRCMRSFKFTRFEPSIQFADWMRSRRIQITSIAQVNGIVESP